MNEVLASALKLARKKPCHYCLVWKDAKNSKLIVSRKQIKPAQIKQARAETKGNKVLRGCCYGEGGASFVFERLPEDLEPPKGALLLKLLIASETGLKVKPAFLEVLELTEVPEEDDEATAPDDRAEPPALPGPATSQDARLAAAGLRRWLSARDDAVAQLRTLAAAVAATRDADAKGVIRELKAVIERLTQELYSSEQADALFRFVQSDEVVEAAEQAPRQFGFVRIRKRLLGALDVLR